MFGIRPRTPRVDWYGSLVSVSVCQVLLQCIFVFGFSLRPSPVLPLFRSTFLPYMYSGLHSLLRRKFRLSF